MQLPMEKIEELKLPQLERGRVRKVATIDTAVCGCERVKFSPVTAAFVVNSFPGQLN